MAVLTGAAAFAVYKLKKEEKKRIIDLDQDLLYDEPEQTPDADIAADETEAAEEAPISEPVFHHREADTGSKDISEEASTTGKAMDYGTLTAAEIDAIKAAHEETLAQLQEQGDVAVKERLITHTVVFADVQDKEAFKHEVINRGFVISAGEQEQVLLVLHISPLDIPKLLDNSLYIADRAKACHGEYKGWQTKAVF